MHISWFALLTFTTTVTRSAGQEEVKQSGTEVVDLNLELKSDYGPPPERTFDGRQSSYGPPLPYALGSLKGFKLIQFPPYNKDFAQPGRSFVYEFPQQAPGGWGYGPPPFPVAWRPPGPPFSPFPPHQPFVPFLGPSWGPWPIGPPFHR